MLRKFSLALIAALTSVAAWSTTPSPIQLLNPTGSTSGQAIVSTGSSTAPTWGGVGVNGIAAIAANTVITNATGSAASPTAFAMPSCGTPSSALGWASGSGFTCNTSVNAAQLGGATFAAPGSIGSTTAGSGAFTTLSASSTVSGTGFSTYLASPPAIGTTTPAVGKFTTLQATGTITPSSTSGIVGTITNDNANVGSVGEFPSPTNLANISLSNGGAANVSSVSLTAGDWDVQCDALFTPAATTTVTSYGTGVSTTSATYGAAGTYTALMGASWTGSLGTPAIATPVVRVSLASTTTVYCVASATFGTSTMTASGYLRARRSR
jgi:hypothetical protein